MFFVHCFFPSACGLRLKLFGCKNEPLEVNKYGMYFKSLYMYIYIYYADHGIGVNFLGCIYIYNYTYIYIYMYLYIYIHIRMNRLTYLFHAFSRENLQITGKIWWFLMSIFPSRKALNPIEAHHCWVIIPPHPLNFCVVKSC